MKLRIPIYGRNSHQLRSGVFDTEFIGDITPYLLHNDHMGAKITTKVGEEWLTTMSVDEYCLETGICDTAQIRNLDITSQDQNKFKFEPCIPVLEWGNRFVEVHGKNGMVALAWFCAALFRDIIYPKVSCFPHLFLFGPPRAGKSYTAWSLQYMFGANPKGPTNFVQATDAAFFSAFSWNRNAVSWIDEYCNEGTYTRIEVLKMAYDGVGREKTLAAYSNDVTKTPINNGVCISGQQLPTQDVALMTRCICLSYPKREYTIQEEENATNLRDIEQSGMLTHITARLMEYRDVVDNHFHTYVNHTKSILRDYLQKEGIIVDSRLLLNYSIMLGVYEILISKTPLRFGFDSTILQEFALESLINQSNAIRQ